MTFTAHVIACLPSNRKTSVYSTVHLKSLRSSIWRVPKVLERPGSSDAHFKMSQSKNFHECTGNYRMLYCGFQK